MTLNGTSIQWRCKDDLPTMCGQCPFYFDGHTDAPVGAVQERGHCMLRDKMKSRWADCPKVCLGLFSKVLAYPEDASLVVVLKD